MALYDSKWCAFHGHILMINNCQPSYCLAHCLSRSGVYGDLANQDDVAGLVHFGQNLQCDPAQFIATFPTRDPGTVTVSLAFFNLPLSALRATLGLDDATLQAVVDQVNSPQQVNPSFDTECLARCNIPLPEFTKENTFTQVPGSSW